MEKRFGLRLRIFLMFALLAGAIAVVVAVALVLGYRYAARSDAWNGFVAAGLVAGFGVLGVSVFVWLLFDENVAKPIQRLASQLRTQAHAGSGQFAELTARYLGDLGPAAQALSQRLGEEQDGAVDEVTARLQAERAWLTGLLSEIPIAVVLLSETGRIVLYDAQAGEILAQVATPRLGAPIDDYLDRAALDAARRDAVQTAGEIAFDAAAAQGDAHLRVRLKSHGSGEMLILEQPAAGLSSTAARPLVFDFQLLESQGDGPLTDRPLPDIPYVVFDTETTGLEPARDELVQIAAVRVINGRMVAGEAIDTLVNPGRSIPQQASRVHGITDAQVADAPAIPDGVRRLHGFAQDAVLVAHNAPFDLVFLKRQEAAIGARFDHPVVDTVLLSAVLFGTNETHSLDAVCDRLGIEIPAERRHTALGDAEATAAALCTMIPMLQGRGFTTLREVLQETRRYGRLLQDLNA